MPNEIISYIEMCRREGVSLQRGMNYRLGESHSVILMSVRPGAPYADRFEEDGSTLVYEGHDVPKSPGIPDPKATDQLQCTSAGSLTENGKFLQAASEYRDGLRLPELVRVYEKIKQGIWSYNGLFQLVDAWREHDGVRQVFKFKLLALDVDDDLVAQQVHENRLRRIIPTSIKLEVWHRDGGKCVRCGSSDNLHFDHIIPWSKGGSSNTADNIQLLCSRHNLEKSDRIE